MRRTKRKMQPTKKIVMSWSLLFSINLITVEPIPMEFAASRTRLLIPLIESFWVLKIEIMASEASIMLSRLDLVLPADCRYSSSASTLSLTSSGLRRAKELSSKRLALSCCLLLSLISP